MIRRYDDKKIWYVARTNSSFASILFSSWSYTPEKQSSRRISREFFLYNRPVRVVYKIYPLYLAQGVRLAVFFQQQRIISVTYIFLQANCRWKIFAHSSDVFCIWNFISFYCKSWKFSKKKWKNRTVRVIFFVIFLHFCDPKGRIFWKKWQFSKR